MVHWLPFAYFYFPLVWYGYILTLDGGLELLGKDTLWRSHRGVFLAMIPISAVFWWTFELFDQAVDSWHYINGGAFAEVAYPVIASICFSTVMLAVWETACVTAAVVGNISRGWMVEVDVGRSTPLEALAVESPATSKARPPEAVLISAMALGVACIVIPVLFPRYAFGLIWGSLFFLLDPVNAWLGRPSLIADAVRGRFRRAVIFASAALVCGFFWEFWNYWAVVKWIYTVPFVSQLHLFEMPLPGYLGYLPFGLEVFAATEFCLAIGRMTIGSRLSLLSALVAQRGVTISEGRRP